MKIHLSTRPALDLAADLLVLPLRGELQRDPLAVQLNERSEGDLFAEARRQQFGNAGRKELWYRPRTRLPAHHVFLLASPADNGGGPSAWYSLADSASRAAEQVRAARAVVPLAGSDFELAVAAVAEGLALTRYRFDRFRSQPAPQVATEFHLVVPRVTQAARSAVERSAATAAAVSLARDLANTPAGALTPRDLAAQALGLRKRGLNARVHDVRALRRLGMGALLGVAQGSREEPRFIEIAYRPQRPRRRVALVGKGITFDSGGLSLKNADSMQAQKRDMAGGAVVLGAMSALPALAPAVEVRGYIASSENMPGSGAMKPGDVLRAFNGTTIEVLNTDAEGRLVLADALSYAARQRPDAMLDFATLTAAVRAALGNRYAAIMGTDAALVKQVIAAGAASDERLWELPLVQDYRRDLDSRVADLKNIGEGYAGTIIGGLFLREFTAGIPWAHIDFSSTVMSEGYACHPKGASGFGVRTALRWICSLAS